MQPIQLLNPIEAQTAQQAQEELARREALNRTVDWMNKMLELNRGNRPITNAIVGQYLRMAMPPQPDPQAERDAALQKAIGLYNMAADAGDQQLADIARQDVLRAYNPDYAPSTPTQATSVGTEAPDIYEVWKQQQAQRAQELAAQGQYDKAKQYSALSQLTPEQADVYNSPVGILDIPKTWLSTLGKALNSPDKVVDWGMLPGPNDVRKQRLLDQYGIRLD